MAKIIFRFPVPLRSALHGISSAIFSFFVAMTVLSSCGNQELTEEQGFIEPQPVAVNISTTVPKIDIPRHSYRGDRFRDPFIPLSGTGIVLSSTDEVQVPNISSLVLKGILMMAIKRWPS